MKKIGFIFFVFTLQAHAFTLLTTNDKGWNKKVLVFNLNPQNCPASIRFNIEEAMHLWNTINNSNIKLELSSTDTVTTTAQALTGSFSEDAVIICETNFGVLTAEDPNFVAGTSQVAMDTRGIIYKGYLILNAEPVATASILLKSDLNTEIIAAHEIGHVLGLGHSSDIAAMMYFDTTRKSELSLAQDDIDGITYLYPRDETGGDPFMGGCGFIQNRRPPNSKSVLFLFLLFCLPALLLWQRRKNHKKLEANQGFGFFIP